MEKQKTGNGECFGEMPQGAPQGTYCRTLPWMLREMPPGMPSGFYNNFFYCILNVECCSC